MIFTNPPSCAADPEAWHPDGHATGGTGREWIIPARICRMCPAARECRDEGLSMAHSPNPSERALIREGGMRAALTPEQLMAKTWVDACPEPVPLPRCVRCDRELRPWRGLLEQYPGAVARQTNRCCTSCWWHLGQAECGSRMGAARHESRREKICDRCKEAAA